MLFEIDIQTIALLMTVSAFVGFIMGVALNKPQGK